MGTFRYPIEVGDLLQTRYLGFEALVDTGSTYAVFPASVLEGLGVSRIERWPFELADTRRPAPGT